MKIKLERKHFGSKSTIGDLSIDGVFFCHTLEDKFREVAGVPVQQWKVNGETAIPVGTYKLIIDMSTRFQKMMPHILNVPGFEGIRIHVGNYAKDTEGCILLGVLEDVKTEMIGQSKDAMAKFMAAIANQKDITIEIV